MGAPALITAPSVAVYINAKPYGVVFNFGFNSSTPRKRVKSIDILTALELAPTSADVSFTMSLYRLRGGGGLQGANIVAPMPDLAQEGYFSIVFLDLITKFVIFQARNCSVESENWHTALKNYMIGDVSCSALSWSNEVVSLNGNQS